MGMPAPHKIVLKELLDSFKEQLDRLEAVVARLEAEAPHSLPPTDPAALEAAERYIKERTLELRGGGGLDAD